MVILLLFERSKLLSNLLVTSALAIQLIVSLMIMLEERHKFSNIESGLSRANKKYLQILVEIREFSEKVTRLIDVLFVSGN